MRIAVNYHNIQILSDELTNQEAEDYCRYAANEREKVEIYWGATWSEPIRIHVDSSYQISKALIPAYHGNRGFMEMPLHRVKSNNCALLHEIVHIYAPNDNRFLAEGLAVYLQDILGGNPSYPNFGNHLNDKARGRAFQINSLQSLDNIRTPASLGKGVEGTTAYIIGGSFVGFLIEKYGLSQFKNVYESGDYSKIQGKTLQILENEWRFSLQDT